MKSQLMKSQSEVEYDSLYMSMTKLVGLPIKDVIGYVDGEFGHVVFKVCAIVFDDGTPDGVRATVDGEHEIAFCHFHHDLVSQEQLDQLFEESL